MKYKNIFRLLTPLIAIVLLAAFIPGDKQHKENIILNVVIQSLNSSHYTPLEINDDFSEKVFDLFVQRLDYNKRFLIEPDIESMKKYRHKIDNEIKDITFNFLNVTTELLIRRTKEAQQYYRDILKEPFNFNKNEEIELNPKRIKYAKNKKGLKEQWRKYLKYDVLTRFVDFQKIQEKAIENNDTTVEILSFEALEAKARKKVLKTNDDWFHRMSKIEDNDRFTYYINSIINIYDPHSGYFPPKDKEDFDIAMSGKLEGIGAQLSQRNKYIKVVRIIPGSASWKQGELKAGDIILKVAQGDEEPLDIVDMRLDKAVRFIRGKKGTEARLTIKRVDGTIKVISIIRDIVILDETFAKSMIITDEKSGKKIGYLKLPSFYVDFNNLKGRNASDDVKKELKKLMSEGISGLIFDVRNDGGGSLPDAIDIAGMFIKEGPIVQVKSRIGAPYIYRDKDPSVIYNGPLVVLVNSFSASASEIFAAAMQDYKRAIIIRSTTKFGKGTVQKFADLDNLLKNDFNYLKPLGSLKLTLQKFYRINGGATQLKGITPDIILPSVYSYIDIGEKEMDYAIQWDEITPSKYKKWNKSIDLERIKKFSDNRIKSDTIFQLLNEKALKLKDQRDNTTKSLNLEKYNTEEKKNRKESKRYNAIGKQVLGLNLHVLKSDLTEIEADSSKMARRDAWRKNLQKDIFLNEAVNVITDFKHF